MMQTKTICDFCSAGTDQRKIIIAGNNDTHICEQCVVVCVGMVVERMAQINDTEAEATKDGEQC